MYYLGVDVGSLSCDAVLIDEGAIAGNEVGDRDAESRQEVVDPPITIEEVWEGYAELREESSGIDLVVFNVDADEPDV